jgi:hypothetical protein
VACKPAPRVSNAMPNSKAELADRVSLAARTL